MLKILQGDALEKIKEIESESIDCIVTSPPYWQLRDYGIDEQLGLEETVEEYLERLISVFDEAWRVLKDSGTVFVNMGDTYSNVNSKFISGSNNKNYYIDKQTAKTRKKTDIRRKSKMMIPERFAIAMIERGWILRNEIIWHKPNVVPEAVNDRFTNDFEKIYFFTKNEKYYFEKQYEPYSEKTLTAFKDGIMPTGKKKMLGAGESKTGMREINKPWKAVYSENGRNMRTVWNIATKGIKEAHFATFPEELVRRCILAGCPENGIVLDPFLGSGTSLKVAKKFNRNGIGIELNPDYINMSINRIGTGLFEKIEIG
nr:MAG TPA: adenine-specific methyltransferase [Caudoviricetes sp.]